MERQRWMGRVRGALWFFPAMLGSMLALAWMFWGRPIQWDEFEFARATAWVSEGRVPFRDFFEHHTPLQWLVFAPVAAAAKALPGVAPYLVLRAGQLLLVILPMVFLAWSLSPGGDGSERGSRARWAVLALLLLGPGFAVTVGEYRVDALGNMLFMAAIWASLRSESSKGRAFWTGFLLSLSGLANLRMGPLVLFLVLLLLFLRPESRKWGRHPRWPWIAAGAALPMVLWGIYLAMTHSWSPAWNRLIVDNAAGNSLLGKQFKDMWGLFRDLANMGDFPGLLLLGLGAIGAGLAVWDWRRPGPLQILTVMTAVDLLFIWSMNVQYPYHLQGVFLMAVPLAVHACLHLADWIKVKRVGIRLPAPSWVAGLVLAASAGWGCWVFWTRSAHMQMQSQDWVLREAVKLTEPGETIWDGNGAVLQREPSSYPYWFLPFLVRFGQPAGLFQDYSAEDFLAHPPALILADTRTHNWLGEHPRLRAVVVTHFLPYAQNLWIPALSGEMGGSGQHDFAWVVPRAAHYKLYCSPSLAGLPWFQLPLAFEFIGNPNTSDPRLINAPDPTVHLTGFQNREEGRLAWTLNGRPIQVTQAGISLNKGDRLSVHCGDGDDLGVLLVPDKVRDLFQIPWVGAPFDAVNVYMNWKVIKQQETR